jgi:hypothetical protein
MIAGGQMRAELKYLISKFLVEAKAATSSTSIFCGVLLLVLTIFVLHALADPPRPHVQKFLTQRTIESRFKEKGKTIVFSFSEKYEKERRIVRHFFHIEDSENSGENTLSNAEIAIAVIDLNDDGIDEIIAYVGSPEFCGSHGCTLLILERGRTGKWKDFSYATGWVPSAVLPEKHLGYRDILDRTDSRENDASTHTTIIFRFDGISSYGGYLKRQRHIDSPRNIETISTWICDTSCNKWRLLDER